MMTSLNGGTTWQQTIGDDLQNDTTVNSVSSCVLYANGRWLVGCQYGSSPTNPNWRPVVTSTDGINWSYVNVGASITTATRIAYGNGRWIISGYSSTATTSLVTSTDGINFTDITGATGLPAVGTVSYPAVYYGNGRWVLGKNGSGSCLYTSTDGLSWTPCLGDTFPGALCKEVYWNGSLWVALGFENPGSPPGAYTITTSSDGITWTRNTTATFTYISAYAAYYGLRARYGNGRWIAIGQDSLMLTSTDGGVTWSIASPTGITTSQYIDIAWTGQQWILTGGTSTVRVFTSPNGLNWTQQTLPPLSPASSQGYAIGVKY